MFRPTTLNEVERGTLRALDTLHPTVGKVTAKVSSAEFLSLVENLGSF